MPATSMRCVNSSTAANGSRKCGYAAGWLVHIYRARPFAAGSLGQLPQCRSAGVPECRSRCLRRGQAGWSSASPDAPVVLRQGGWPAVIRYAGPI
jgi:hypothetical protein